MPHQSDHDREAEAGRLVAVVVTHDRLEQLELTVARLLEAKPAELHGVVVVDNASSDGTADWLTTVTDTRLSVIHLPQNRGGAGGFAAGIGAATDRFAPDWVVVMDDDARPHPGAIAAFHAAPRDVATAYAAAVRLPDGTISEMNRPGLNPFRRPRALMRALTGQGRAGYHLPDAAFTAPPQPVDMGSFVGLFLPKEAIRRVGLPDAGLFLYGDDVIYCLGLRKAGIDILFDPSVTFEHECSTFQSGPDRRVITPLWKVYYFARNRLIMYRAAAGPVLFWLFAPAILARWWLGARAYGDQAPVYRRILARGIADGLTRHTGLTHGQVRALERGEAVS